jgi:hypothetical protein
MSANNAKPKSALGFLTVLDHPQHGLFGGYLILNMAGRPLEFHCTAPIKPNRAQEILYGPTLESFLYGEQIGFTLLEQAKIDPLLVCTDRQAALAVRELIALPVALVLPADSSGETGAPNPGEAPAGQSADGGQEHRPRLRLDRSHTGGPQLFTFRVGRNHLAVPQRSEADQPLIAQRLAELGESFDLAEPFHRIREAIEEAQQAVR